MANLRRFYEFTYYIPPDVTVNDDGSIDADDLDKVYQFDNNRDLFLLSFTGMGMPPINYIDQQGPDQHGTTLLDYRLGPRIIQLLHRRHAAPCTGREGYWTARHDILNHLRPNRQAANDFSMGRLRKRLPGGLLRDIDVLIQQGPIFAARDIDLWDEWAFTETLRFIAPDPTFYDPEQQTLTWTSEEATGEVELMNDLIFETSHGLASEYPTHWQLPFAFDQNLVIDSVNDVEFTGSTGQAEPTWHAFPTIVITGPLINPHIENTSTDEVIEMDYTVSGGEVITIDLAYGNKTVTNAAGTNLIGTVTPESNLATFHLGVAPEVPNSNNEISITGQDAVADVSGVTVRWYWRYIGI